jgi:hypothetical protein
MYNRHMAFTVSDYSDLIKLLREHPEWREELRREILDDERRKRPESAVAPQPATELTDR